METPTLTDLIEQREALLQEMRQIERSLGDQTKRASFVTQHGPSGNGRYDYWRISAQTRLTAVAAEYRALKQQIQVIQRQSEIVQLLEDMFFALADLPELHALRERVRVFARDHYEAFFIDERHTNGTT